MYVLFWTFFMVDGTFCVTITFIRLFWFEFGFLYKFDLLNPNLDQKSQVLNQNLVKSQKIVHVRPFLDFFHGRWDFLCHHHIYTPFLV